MARPSLNLTEEEMKQRLADSKRKWYEKQKQDPEFRKKAVVRMQQWRLQQQQSKCVKA